MLESHRRQVADVEQAVGRLQQEMANVVAIMHEVRNELQARAVITEQARQDHGDVEVLASQVAAVTNKANEVDGLRMQVELLKNRMKRFEDLGLSGARPGSQHREAYEVTSQPTPTQHPAHLPPMRTQPVLAASPDRDPLRPMLAPSAQPGQSYRTPATHASNEQYGVHVLPGSGLRPAEPLPPPSALSGWRQGEAQASHAPLAHSRPPAPTPYDQAPPQHPPERSIEQSGWAAVNANQPLKRSFDSPYDKPASAPGSPKRPKLAPIMPRGGYLDDSYTAMSSHGAALSSQGPLIQSRGRAPSDPSQAPEHALPTPASANAHYRFIPSIAETQAWRGEMEDAQGQSGSGRGRSRVGRGRAGRGRGSRGGTQARQSSQELDTGEIERDWVRHQTPPGGQLGNVPAQGPTSQFLQTAVGGSIAHGLPAAPVHLEETMSAQTEFAMSNSGKKSRSKPIRNAEGILIRKDGRPDMRSVSSANNLRKVHAKREAERAEAEGRTPTSARSLAPAQSNSMSDDEHEGRLGTPESALAEAREDEATRGGQRGQSKPRAYPYGISAPDVDRGYASQDERPLVTGPALKQEEVESETRQGSNVASEESNQRQAPCDTAMQDTEARKEDRRVSEPHEVQEDVKMASTEGRPPGRERAAADNREQV